MTAQGTHGVLDFEHERPQTFIVDVTLSVDLSRAGRTDDLGDTVDYGQIAKRIVNVIEGEHVDLVECLASRIADAILLSHMVRKVVVTVHKPHAPITVPFGDVSVTIERSRDGRTGSASDRRSAVSETGPSYAVGGADGAADVPDRIHHAVIAMGGNLGEVERTLRSAVVSVDGIPGNQVTGISPLYRTAAWGMEPGTPDFLNAVVQVTTRLDAAALLSALQTIESAYGRSRQVHWGSRPLDLDIVDFDGVISDDPDLTLPHPRAWQRAFVLAPWADLDPDAMLAGPHGGRVADLLASAPDHDAVERISDEWILGGMA